MISIADKIIMLNSMLAGVSPSASEIYANATAGIRQAIKCGEVSSLEAFARRALAVYNPAAKLEFIDFSGGYFDPLFAAPAIVSALRRLSGYKCAVLIINGLSEIPAGRRRTVKMRLEKAGDFDFVEDYVLRYKKSFPQIEVFFI